MDCCKKNVFVLLKGYASRWDGVDWMSISFRSDVKNDFTGFSAKFKIGQYIFENDDLSQDWIINLTDEQTGTLPLGPNTASLIVYDTEGDGKPFTTSIPILVKDWVEGDVTIDTYKATILATLDNKNEFIINVETAKASLEYVDERIAEHNLSEEAHPYIQLILSQKQDKLTSENAGTGISIEDVDGKVVISNTQTSAEWGNITGNIQDQEDLQQALSGKQDTLIAGQNITIEDNVISATGGNFNIDGGKANSVYTLEQDIYGGDAQ